MIKHGIWMTLALSCLGYASSLRAELIQAPPAEDEALSAWDDTRSLGLFDETNGSELTAQAVPREKKLEDFLSSAKQLIQDQEWNAASDLLHEALELYPNQPDLLSYAGHVYMIQGLNHISESYWAKLAELFPQSARAHACWAGLLIRLDRIADAEKELQVAQKLDPQGLIARYHKSCLKLREQKVDEALHLLNNLSCSDMGYLATWARDDKNFLHTFLGTNNYATLAQIIASGGDPTAFQEMPKPAHAELLVTKTAASLWQTYLAEKSKNWEQATKILDEMISHQITAPAITMEKAHSLHQLGQTNEAYTLYSGVVSAHPGNEWITKKYGWFCLELERYKDAQKIFDNLRSSSSRDPENTLGLAASLAAQDNVGQAWGLLESIPRSDRPALKPWFQTDKPWFASLTSSPKWERWMNAEATK